MQPKKEIFTTGQKDIDWLIFDELSDKDIIHLCQLNKEMSHLCEDEKFWEYRSKRRYPTFHKTKTKYTGFKSFYAQTRRIPHYFDDISLNEWNIKTADYNIVLPKEAFTRIGKLENVNKGDVVDIQFKKSDSEFDSTYIVTKIKGDQVTLTRIETEYGHQTKMGVWKIPEEAEEIFLSIGLNAYKHTFDRNMPINNVKKMNIQVGKYTFHYP